MQASSSSISESIQRAALELGGDFLVMGAFGHSRLRDFILGGADRHRLGGAALAGPHVTLAVAAGSASSWQDRHYPPVRRH